MFLVIRSRVLLLIFILSSTTLDIVVGQLEVESQWNFLKYNAPYNFPVLKNYNPENAVITGLEVGWDRLFIATPRLWPGNPSTLSWIPRHKLEYGGESPVLEAYPSWSWHRAAASNSVYNTKENCTNIISVFRIRLDRCDRLWVLDSGVADSLVTFEVVCPPKLLLFDSRTDELIRIVTFPPEILRRSSLLTNLVIDEATSNDLGLASDCDNAFAYITDSVSPALIVYDARKDTAWRITNPYMFPDPDYGTYKVNGESFTLMDGIIGIALSAPSMPHKQLYFQPFASNRIFTVPTAVLKSGPNTRDDGELPVSLVGHKSSQAAPLAVDPRTGALIFSPVSETAIASWIPGSIDHGVLAYDPELLQFPLDIRISERDNGNIWIVSTKFQKYFRKTVNGQEINIRIIRIKRTEPYFGSHNNSYYQF